MTAAYLVTNRIIMSLLKTTPSGYALNPSKLSHLLEPHPTDDIVQDAAAMLLAIPHEMVPSLDNNQDEQPEASRILSYQACVSKVLDSLELEDVHPKLLAACFLHGSPHMSWSNDDIRNKVEDLLARLCKRSTVSSQCSEYIKQILEALHARDWKHRPWVLLVVKTIVLNISHPDMSQALEALLPLTLQVIDHYEISTRIIAIQICHRIIQETPASQLNHSGVAKVLYDALSPTVYTSEMELVPHSWPCMATLLTVIQHNPMKNGDELHHQVLSQALTLARYQDKISKRQIYAQALGPLIQSCRLACVAFMSSLFPLGLEYIQDVDPITRLHGLDMMQSLLVQARPRITAKRVEELRAGLKEAKSDDKLYFGHVDEDHAAIKAKLKQSLRDLEHKCAEVKIAL
eukprot:TRINITY_DN7593_c0_g1_i5.p1 TRINITY_DN7593_c0_g1~~TRINITY_DN7593_c0_g1_i5.p1  ORF type:complete len:403 (+),score=70.63 TRINITY_DN7593_c0_g1_i5:45-1253(+)